MVTATAASVLIKTTQTRSKFNLEDVLLQKTTPFTPVQDASEALAQLGNDSDSFLRIINEGLRIELRKKLEADTFSPWYEVDPDTKKVSDVPFTEPTVDSAAVSKLVMTIALVRYGYSADLTKEQKKAAKAKAFDFVKENAAILLQDAVSSTDTEDEG
jgi:hypothetical protein